MADAIERPLVHCTDNDLIAAMQILACIARPHRAASAGELMQQWYWARKRHRREALPDDLQVEVPDKDRIAAKLPALSKDIAAGLEAGAWLKRKWMAESDGALVRAFGASFRQQGAKAWNDAHRRYVQAENDLKTSRDDESAAAKQRIWTKRRPVAHMALAVREQLRLNFPEGLEALEALVFNPAWVAGALERAEGYAGVAVRLDILAPDEPWRFIR